MISTKVPIYLASKSPRRKKLLKQLKLKFKCVDLHFYEKVNDDEDPVFLVKRLSIEKLNKALLKIKNGIIITADTIVVIDNQILGKPKNKIDAKRILKKLSGRTHNVYTGFSIYNSDNNKVITDFENTLVTFRQLTDSEIDDYISTDSPMDKAGAYGIQDDFGAVFIEKIDGCYYNVVGLPLAKFYHSLLRII
jgi:septum formation protein